jgi:SAM-dependent methyltransferase
MPLGTQESIGTNKSLAFDLEALAQLDNYYRWIVEEIRPFLGDRLVEIGAGIGTFTNALVVNYLSHNPAARLEAFEPESLLYRQLHKRLALAHPDLIRTGRLVPTEGYFRVPQEPCDTVLMVNVLEHIQDDQESVRMIHHALSSGGTLAIYSPAMQWLYSRHDQAVGHYRRYEKTRLAQLMLGVGFEVITAKYMDCMGVLPWYLLNVIGGFTSINSRLARLYDTWFVPITRWMEGREGPRIGKNILMIGRKVV